LRDPNPKSRRETGMVEKDRTVVVAEHIELVVGRCSWKVGRRCIQCHESNEESFACRNYQNENSTCHMITKT
jgi:hypothetical protein